MENRRFRGTQQCIRDFLDTTSFSRRRPWRYELHSMPQKLFSECSSAGEVAEILRVPVGAVYCIELEKDTTCGIEGCMYPAVRRNAQKGHNSGPRCCIHNKVWYPKPHLLKHTYGHKLLGPQFLRPDKGSCITCACQLGTCIGIGYSKSMVWVPKNEAIRKQVVHALGIRKNSPAG